MILPLGDKIPRVSEKAYIHPSAEIIGDVHICDNVWVGPQVSLRGDVGSIEILYGTNVQDGVIVHSFPGQMTSVKQNAHIGHGAILHGCMVEENVLIGIRSTILDGTTIPSNTIIGAHSLVVANSKLEPKSLYFGNPAKWQRYLTTEEVDWIESGVNVYKQLVELYTIQKNSNQCLDIEIIHTFKPDTKNSKL
jgi:phenylacetic acid degradation protein